MEYLKWSPEFEVGNETIDFQHQNLVNMLNNLHEATTLDAESARVVMQVTLENLLQYTVFHFGTEEKFMAETKYPDMDSHIAQHVALKGKVVAFYKQFEEGKLGVPELLEFLKGWLVNHIAHTDKKLGTFLVDK